jgi:hypothetical protein
VLSRLRQLNERQVLSTRDATEPKLDSNAAPTSNHDARKAFGIGLGLICRKTGEPVDSPLELLPKW